MRSANILPFVLVVSIFMLENFNTSVFAQTDAVFKAKENCVDFYSNPTFLVRFQERDQQLEALQRIATPERVAAFKEKRIQFRKDVLSALTAFPGTIAYFTTDHLREVQSGDYRSIRKPNGEFFDIDLNAPIFIIDPHIIKSSSFNQNLDGFSLLFPNGEKVAKPFPNFVLGRFLFFKREFTTMVREWLEKIDVQCSKLNGIQP